MGSSYCIETADWEFVARNHSRTIKQAFREDHCYDASVLDPPMGAIYLRAVFWAQRAGHAKAGVDDFLTALDRPDIDNNFIDFDPRNPPMRPGHFPLSDELQKALAAAGWQTLGEKITNDMLRQALVRARNSRG